MQLKIDMSKSESWVAFAVTGVISIPACGLGLGPDIYLIPVKGGLDPSTDRLCAAVEESYRSFGIEDHKPLTYGTVKVVLVPMQDVSDYGVKVGLMVADFALSIFNKKVFSAKTRLIGWHRKEGTAVGVVITKGEMTPIAPKNRAAGPALISPPGTDAWDVLLHQTLTDTLPPLAEALRRCMEWERESQQTANITHRLAFLWVGLESMLPRTERDGPGCAKRFSILTGSPAGYYSNKIRNNPELSGRQQEFTNPDGRLWRSAIDEMYRYRCEILHAGGTELSSDTLNPLKVDWYGKLAELLCTRLTGLAITALGSGVNQVEDFWESFVPEFLYSDDNHWFKTGVFFHTRYINYDWESGPYPDPFA